MVFGRSSTLARRTLPNHERLRGRALSQPNAEPQAHDSPYHALIFLIVAFKHNVSFHDGLISPSDRFSHQDSKLTYQEKLATYFNMIARPAFDVVVIGAGRLFLLSVICSLWLTRGGWYGLAAAKAQIETHPEQQLLLLDGGTSFGGTWGKDRLYPGLKSNNLWGSYEFPDFRMDGERYGIREGSHIPAATLHQYLTDFADHFGITERTRFQVKVKVVEATSDDSWLLHTESADSGKEIIRTRKLIVANGLTSEPNLPVYKGQESFTPPFFHAKDFCARADTVQTCARAAVVGAGKSAFDVAYAFATEGRGQVDLIVRPTGQGPVCELLSIPDIFDH